MSLVYLKFERIILKIKGQVRTILSILDRDERKECCLDPTDRKEETGEASHPLSTFTHSRDFCAVHKNSKNALECQRTEEKERLERGEEPTNAAARTLSSSEAALYEEIASPPPETEDAQVKSGRGSENQS